MEHLWQDHGEDVHQKGWLKEHSKSILKYCEDNGIALNAKARTKLLDTSYWLKLRDLLDNAQKLMYAIGTEAYSDFNAFKAKFDKAIKAEKISLSASEKNAILGAISWYDETAEKVIKKTQKFSKSEVETLCAHLGCAEADLADFGYYSQTDGRYITYAPSSDLRDAESVPLKDSIHDYFLTEVQPHVPEAWINMDSVKIGYEISFNKYFYRHKPLRALEDVTRDLLALEKQADGLMAEILGVSLTKGVN